MVTPQQKREFFTAIENGNLIELTRLNKAGIPWTVTMSDGYSPIHAAVESGHVELVRFFHRKGCDLNATTSFMFTPLHIAAQLNRVKEAKYLLENGANPNPIDMDGNTPYQVGMRLMHTKVLGVLKKYDATPKDAYVDAKKKITQLHKAALNGELEDVKKLCACGADVNAQTIDIKMTPAMWTPSRTNKEKDLEILKVLVSYGADLNIKNKNGLTIAHFATMEGRLEILKYLDSQGINLFEPDVYGQTPIVLANESMANMNFEDWSLSEIKSYTKPVNECCEFLKEWYANQKKHSGKENKDGKKEAPAKKTYPEPTPLHVYALNGHLDEVKRLCAEGADVNATTEEGSTPIMWTPSMSNPNDIEIFKVLDAYGADLTAQNKNGQTVAHIAASSGRLDILKYLAARGVNLGEKDVYGQTPLTIGPKHLENMNFDDMNSSEIEFYTKPIWQCVAFLQEWQLNPEKYIDKTLPNKEKYIIMRDKTGKTKSTDTGPKKSGKKTFFKPITLGRNN